MLVTNVTWLLTLHGY